jgi:hypothetical protein
MYISSNSIPYFCPLCFFEPRLMAVMLLVAVVERMMVLLVYWVVGLLADVMKLAGRMVGLVDDD